MKIMENKKKNKSQHCSLFPNPLPTDGDKLSEACACNKALDKPKNIRPKIITHSGFAQDKTVRRQEGTG